MLYITKEKDFMKPFFLHCDNFLSLCSSGIILKSMFSTFSFSCHLFLLLWFFFVTFYCYLYNILAFELPFFLILTILWILFFVVFQNKCFYYLFLQWQRKKTQNIYIFYWSTFSFKSEVFNEFMISFLLVPEIIDQQLTPWILKIALMLRPRSIINTLIYHDSHYRQMMET